MARPSIYHAIIAEAIPGITPHECKEVEEIMRKDIFQSTLDWQTRTELQNGAREAYAMMAVLWPLQGFQA